MTLLFWGSTIFCITAHHCHCHQHHHRHLTLCLPLFIVIIPPTSLINSCSSQPDRRHQSQTQLELATTAHHPPRCPLQHTQNYQLSQTSSYALTLCYFFGSLLLGLYMLSIKEKWSYRTEKKLYDVFFFLY